MPRIVCVLGEPCSGKTTYAKWLRDETGACLLTPGAVFREFFGVGFALQCADSVTPVVTEFWVRSMVRFALEAANTSVRDLIIDGFPRSLGQLDWFFREIEPLPHRWEVHRVIVPHDEMVDRVVARHGLLWDRTKEWKRIGRSTDRIREITAELIRQSGSAALWTIDGSKGGKYARKSYGEVPV